jgi:hypothetical protein
MTNWEFPCAEPATVDVSSWPSGSVAISGQPTDVIAVEVQPGHRGGEELLDQVRVNFSDGRLVITGPKGNIYRRRASLDLTIQVPGGSSCDVTTASADISCVGDLEALGLSTASGDVTVASASGPVSVKTPAVTSSSTASATRSGSTPPPATRRSARWRATWISSPPAAM